MELAKRLDGLPLALTSAASFLERTTCTVQEYLDEYERNWVTDDSENLSEYADRTLFTTWNMSIEKLKNQDPHAAELLRISAFFSNENIYYNLLAAEDPKVWPELGDTLRTKATFDRSMAKLRDYSLIETTHRGYRLHPCVHDWTLSSLNQTIEESDVWRAVKCVGAAANSSSLIWSTDYDQSLARLASHAVRLLRPSFYDILARSELDEGRCNDLTAWSDVLNSAGRTREAMPLVTRGLLWAQQQLGREHASFLYTCNVVGIFQKDLLNSSQAENLLKNAVYGYARSLGPYHINTLDPVHNLAILYQELESYQEAEQMYLWSLSGCEQSYGPEDVNTYWAMMALADLYMAKNELDKAERQFQQALQGFDASIDHDHSFCRGTASRLGAIYEQKEDYNAAAAMYQRVYESCRLLFGQDASSTRAAKADLEQLQRKCLLKASSGPPSALTENPSTSPLEEDDDECGECGGCADCAECDEDDDNAAAAPPPETASSSKATPKDAKAVDQFTIPFNPSKPGRLHCHRCRVSLTKSTERFVCCFCDDHELCGDCHTQFRTKQQHDDALEQAEQKHDRHIFFSCQLAESSLVENEEQNAVITSAIRGERSFQASSNPGTAKSTLGSCNDPSAVAAAAATAAPRDIELNGGADLTLNPKHDPDISTKPELEI